MEICRRSKDEPASGNSSPTDDAAYTRVDMLIVVLGFVILTFAVYPHLVSRKMRVNPNRPRMQCTSNLRQTALALRIWASDHEDRYPWDVSTNKGGTFELRKQAFQCFIVASNELNGPRTLYCPLDKGRARAQVWEDFDNSNLSYFVAFETNSPSAWLSGDRTLTTVANGRVMSGIQSFSNRGSLQPVRGLHQGYCNVVMADGSVTRIRTNRVPGEPVVIVFP